MRSHGAAYSQQLRTKMQRKAHLSNSNYFGTRVHHLRQPTSIIGLKWSMSSQIAQPILCRASIQLTYARSSLFTTKKSVVTWRMSCVTKRAESCFCRLHRVEFTRQANSPARGLSCPWVKNYRPKKPL